MNSVVITKYKDYIFGGLFADMRLMDCEFNQEESESVNVGDIYIGYVENIVKGINAAFVRIKPGLNGYYPLDSNTKHIFMCPKSNDKLSIGDKILVQVKSEAVKTKPFTLTSHISMVGTYCIAVNDGDTVMVSQKIHNKEIASSLRDGLIEYCKNTGLGLVVRTNAENADFSIVAAEAKELTSKLADILHLADYSALYTKLYSGSDPYESFLSKLKLNEIDRIVTDIPDIYNKLLAKKYNIELYNDESYSIIKLYSLETQLEKLLQKRVWLDCGGYLIIEPTEALTVIDVNSGKYQGKKSDLDSAYYKINLEAAVEIARQLRLRNISGIIIIDFINMNDKAQKDKLIAELSGLVKEDKVITTVVDITSLGLVELTRKKVKKPIHEVLK